MSGAAETHLGCPEKLQYLGDKELGLLPIQSVSASGNDDLLGAGYRIRERVGHDLRIVQLATPDDDECGSLDPNVRISESPSPDR